MSVIVTERPGATHTGGDKPTWEVPFNIEGTNDNIEARIQLTLQSVGIYDGLFRQTIHVEHEGFDFYTGKVTYGLNDNQPQDGSISYNFEIGGKTEKIFQSLSTRTYPSNAVDYSGAIGVKKNADQIDVEGVDAPVPSYSFSLKCHLPASYYTAARRGSIYLCSCAPINSAPYWGFDPGEVRFVSASGGLKAGDKYGDIDFKFECSPNLSGITVGDISGISKGGWEYAEVVREPAVSNKSLIPKAVGVYVHRLFNASDFYSLLGV
jgi:hypothetical protein